jgi:hypothetical protein
MLEWWGNGDRMRLPIRRFLNFYSKSNPKRECGKGLSISPDGFEGFEETQGDIGLVFDRLPIIVEVFGSSC